MATVSPKELLGLWSREQLTVEMATGHLLQHLVTLHATTEALKQAVHLLQAQVDTLTMRDDTAPQSAQRKRSSKGRSSRT